MRSKTWVLQSPPPWIALSSVLYKIEQNATLALPQCYAVEQKWMCQLHGILHLPCSLFRTVVLPFHLYLPYGSAPEHCDLPVEDAHWLSWEISLGFHLNQIPIYHMVRIMYISLKQRNMKKIMSSSASRQCKSILFQALQTTHNILVTAWHNFQASKNSSLPSLWGKHDPQHWNLCPPYAYLHKFSVYH